MAKPARAELKNNAVKRSSAMTEITIRLYILNILQKDEQRPY